MSSEIINESVRKILREDIKRTGSITPEKKLVLAAVIGKRKTNKLEKELKAS
jgi:hypothetical protein